MSQGSANVVYVTDEPLDDASLLDLVDHLLNTGVIIHGNLVISLAGVDLVYVGLDVILSSVETALRHMTLDPSLPAGRAIRVRPRKD